jgi:hypothetical protein
MTQNINVFIKLNDGCVGYSHLFKGGNGTILTNNYQGRYNKSEISNIEKFDHKTQNDKMYVSENKDILTALNEVLDFWYLPRTKEEPRIFVASRLRAYKSLFATDIKYFVFTERKTSANL